MTNSEYRKLSGEEKFTVLGQTVSRLLLAGTIYNVDFLELKDRLNTLLETEVDNATDAMPREDRQSLIVGNLAINLYIHQIKGRLLRFNKALGSSQCDPLVHALVARLGEWVAVAEGLKVLQSRVVKGRRLSGTCLSLGRTMENTGTCAICDQNVKMHEGTLCSHGFKVKWNQREGICYGVNRQAWEVSHEAASLYVARLCGRLRDYAMAREGVEYLHEVSYEHTTFAAPVNPATGQRDLSMTKGHPSFEFAKQDYKRHLTANIIAIQSDIAYYDARIRDWTPQPLPGKTE